MAFLVLFQIQNRKESMRDVKQLISIFVDQLGTSSITESEMTEALIDTTADNSPCIKVLVVKKEHHS